MFDDPGIATVTLCGDTIAMLRDLPDGTVYMCSGWSEVRGRERWPNALYPDEPVIVLAWPGAKP